jgi:hypothetical protein
VRRRFMAPTFTHPATKLIATNLRRGNLEARIIFRSLPQPENENGHHPGVLTHLLHEGAAISAECLPSPEGVLAVPRRGLFCWSPFASATPATRCAPAKRLKNTSPKPLLSYRWAQKLRVARLLHIVSAQQDHAQENSPFETHS